MQKTLTSMSTQLHEYSKCQVEQGKKLTEAVTQLTSSYNAIKLAARSTSDPENSALQNLLTKVKLPENYKFSPVKLVNSVAFASVPPSIKGADIKL